MISEVQQNMSVIKITLSDTVRKERQLSEYLSSLSRGEKRDFIINSLFKAMSKEKLYDWINSQAPNQYNSVIIEDKPVRRNKTTSISDDINTKDISEEDEVLSKELPRHIKESSEANLAEQFGVKLSSEEASNLSQILDKNNAEIVDTFFDSLF